MTSLVLLAWFAACSADDAGTDTTGNAGGTDDSGSATAARDAATTSHLGAAGASGVCADEPRADAYEAGMAKRTEGGLRIVLVRADPAPPARLDNSWVLYVEDPEGEPMEGAQLPLDPQMPDHGHGSPREAVVKELGDGEYHAEPRALIMPGYWTVEVSVRLDDASPESVSFGFCVR